MPQLLLLLSICAFSASGMFVKLYGKKGSATAQSSSLYTVFQNLICFILALVLFLMRILIGQMPKISLQTMLFGIVLGLLIAATNFCFYRSISLAGLSFATLCLSCSLIVPTFFGVFYFGDRPNIIQIIGIVTLILVVAYLALGGKKNETGSKAGLIFGVLTLFLNGTVSVTQKLHQTYLSGTEADELLLCAYFFATAFMLPVILTGNKKETKIKFSDIYANNFFFYVAGSAICTLLGNIVLMYLVSRLSPVILFSVRNGGFVILSAIISIILFKEKFKLLQGIAFILGTVSIVMINMI